MKFWFVQSNDLSLREQIVAQISLGISSGELAAGARLPSTRALARRFNIHANTVSAAYKQLEREGRVESRRGSGVFVRGEAVIAGADGIALDRRIAGWFEELRRIGVPRSLITSRLRQWLAIEPPDHFLVVEPDKSLRRIVVAELKAVLGFPVRGIGFLECEQAGVAIWQGAVALTLPSKAARLRELLPPGAERITLQVRSVPGALLEWLPAPAQALVGIVSGWPEFLKLARTMLLAAGFADDTLVLRDSAEADWKRGLEAANAVVCDCVVAEELCQTPSLRRVKVIPFRLIADGSLEQLRQLERGICLRLEEPQAGSITER